jgi:hypothetical protein
VLLDRRGGLGSGQEFDVGGDVHRLDVGQGKAVAFAPGKEIKDRTGHTPAACWGCGWWRRAKSGTTREEATGTGPSVKSTIDYLDRCLINDLDHSQSSPVPIAMRVFAFARPYGVR